MSFKPKSRSVWVIVVKRNGFHIGATEVARGRANAAGQLGLLAAEKPICSVIQNEPTLLKAGEPHSN